MKFWFRPKRFWRYFAFYVPSSAGGWIITAVLAVWAATFFVLIDRASESFGDTLIAFAPWFVAFGLIFDLLCFRLGEYPSWWKKGGDDSCRT
jgi:hypothetical protein